MALTSQPIAGNLLMLDSTTIPEVKSYTVKQKKVYRDNTINMSGQVRATLLGTQPVIDVEIGYTNRDRARDISVLLSQDYFGVTYFDPYTNGNITSQFYASDFSFELEDKDRGIMKPVTVILNPVSMR